MKNSKKISRKLLTIAKERVIIRQQQSKTQVQAVQHSRAVDYIKRTAERHTMKNYEELAKLANALDANALDALVNNTDDFDSASASARERLAIVFFDELAKALDNDESRLVLQVNDATTRAKVKSVTVAYYKTQNVNIQIYAKSRYCAICTTCKDAYRQAILSAVQRESNKANDKTAFEKVEFENALDVIKMIIACVQSVNKQAKADEAKQTKADTKDNATEKAIKDYAKKKKAQTKAKADSAKK